MLNIQEAANFLGIKPITLRKWDREGKLKAIRIGSRQDRRYPLGLLSDFLNQSNQEEKIKWQEYLRSKIAINVVMPIIEGPTKRLHKFWGLNYRHHLSYGSESFYYWCCDEKDNLAVGEKTLQLFSKKSFASRINQIWLKMLAEMREFSDKIYRIKDFSSFSDNKLLAMYSEAVEASAEYEGLAFAIDGLDEVGPGKISEELKKIISAQNTQAIDFNKVFNVLTSPSILSVVAKRDLEVAKLARACKNKEIDKKEADKKLAELAASTWWQDMGWDLYEARTDEILRGVFMELAKDSNLESKIKEWTEYGAKMERAKRSLADELGLQKHPGFLQIMDIVDEFTVLHDWRKEFQMRELYVQMKLLREIARRRAIPFTVLEWATPDEVKRIFFGEKLDLPEIYQRARGFLIFVRDGKMEMLTGDAAERRWREERQKIKGKMLDLGGISASRGKVIAPVFVALSAGEAMKIPAGHVLITSMTTPEFVPAMKKAAAIVTDEGGLTCHAAIISRELGKPCIVGTKYATRVLKTGQTVEVAANHGVVKII